MKKAYLYKYPYDIYKTGETTYNIILDPVDLKESMDIILKLSKSDFIASLEGATFMITDYTTDVSEREDGKLAVKLSATVV
nr:MAG TPA: hypothetical protein [Caudoviricetes sp.]